MNMMTRFAAVAATLAAGPGIAAAQQLNVPKLFTMTERPQEPAPNPADLMGEITTMPFVDLKHIHSHTPEAAAHDIARKLKQQIDANWAPGLLPDPQRF